MARPEPNTPWRDDDEDDFEDDLHEDHEDDDAVDIDQGPGEHDRHLIGDQEEEQVQCPNCNKYVWAQAQRCHRCGHCFQGEAWQLQDAPRTTGWWPRIRLLVTFGIIGVILLEIVLIGFRLMPAWW